MTDVPDPHNDPAFSEPELPPNPSVGELLAEIDRARTRAARTTAKLAGRVDPRRRFDALAHREAQALRWDARRMTADLRAARDVVRDKTPDPVVTGVSTVARHARRVPPPVLFGVLAFLIVVLRTRSRHRAAAAR